jgi:hypothetical protein
MVFPRIFATDGAVGVTFPNSGGGVMKFTRFLIMGAVMLALCFPQGGWATDATQKEAEAAAQSWLALVDGGKYPESWDAGAEIFKKGMPTESWQKTLKANRRHLGKVVSRKLKSATHTKTLPNAPEGEYVVIQYDTSFENRANAIETVTPMQEQDGKWRVAGYSIR